MKFIFKKLFPSESRELIELRHKVLSLTTNLESSEAFSTIMLNDKSAIACELNVVREELANAQTELKNLMDELHIRDGLIEEITRENREKRKIKDILVKDDEGITISLQALVEDNPYPHITLFVGSRKGGNWEQKPAQVVSEIAGKVMLGDAAAAKAWNSRLTKKTKRRTNSTGPK
jgi:hypothetical protein